MRRLWISVVFLLMTGVLAGSVFRDAVMTYFDQRLGVLLNDGVFTGFVSEHPEFFPEVSAARPVHVVVEKEHVRIANKKIGIGVSYLQVFIEGEPDYLRQMMESPHWYKHIYNLDRDASLGPVGENGVFKAHIFKKVPVIPNQDYILAFSRESRGDLWFQRATAIEDRKDFALRDNLKVIQPVAGGVVFRELSFVYPLNWWARALSGAAHKTMIKELRIMGNAIKCITEKGAPFEVEFAASCWRKLK